jgi:hypothetical protein
MGTAGRSGDGQTMPLSAIIGSALEVRERAGAVGLGVRGVDERLSIRETRDGDIVRLVVSGDLDAGAERQLASALASVLDEPVGVIFVDVAGMPFVSATALLEIAAVAEIVPVKLTAANRTVSRMAAILGVAHLITIDVATTSAA